MRMIKLTLSHQLNIPVFVNSEAIDYMYRDTDGYTIMLCGDGGDGPSISVRETPEEIMALINS